MKRREEERRKEAREKEGCVFCASPLSPFLSLSFSSKSHPRLNFGFASKSLRERCLAASSRRFDPTFLSPWLDGSAGGLEGEGYTRAIPTPCTPSKILRWSRSIIVGESRRLRNDFIGSLTGSLLSRFPWHTVMKIYRRLYRGWDHRERRRMAYCRFAMGKVFKV